MKIAVIGAGSSGLITLKYLLEHFPADAVHCFEQSQSIRGCWGDQRADFISTSTKYTTQFFCFRRFPGEADEAQTYHDFYRGGEFGDYLEDFATHFGLKACIQFGVSLEKFTRVDAGWLLELRQNQQITRQKFDALFICTGLVNKPMTLETTLPISLEPEKIRQKTVVVVGGGESAADIANHLAKPDFGNRVYLSLRSGIRVSPRYHPIRGVPSDFLRNRLLLTPNQALRNTLGELFVTFRIRYQQLLERFFPRQQAAKRKDYNTSQRRKFWDLRLKGRAKGRLFNVFHNKSDDFLDAVAEKRLHIISEASDANWRKFNTFDTKATLELEPDILVPATGYHSRLAEFSDGNIQLGDFYHGCIHVDNNKLFLIGFARPIIGNIPSISEMQARYAVGLLAKRYTLADNIQALHKQQWQDIRRRYPSINTANVYPVEQYPYCDVLAKEMGIMPSLTKVAPILWLKMWLEPASTWHYLDEFFDADMLRKQKVYTPALLNILLGLIVVLEKPWRWLTKPKT